MVLWWHGGEDPEHDTAAGPELHARLTAVARRNHRSLHSQVLTYIERGLEQDQDEQRKAD